ncbi:GMC family oxidoreductase [Cyanobium sp. FGCU-6]|jgi:choline dehydrogenase-like flavoprotein|nr:GMC family oxidoreductase [Cyanobium sp. FGCU6]
MTTADPIAPDSGAGFDAVVVGAGATGGVAAMALSEAGLRVLVLEAGPELTARQALGSEPLNSLRRLANLAGGRQRRQAEHPGYWKHNPGLFVDEVQNPYLTPDDAPFLWTRGRQVGGRSLTWGGITLRLSDHEFQAGRREGKEAAWPISSRDLAPWYSRLERLLGVHGHRDGLPQLPDGDFCSALPFTPAEEHLQAAVARELGLPLIHSRGFALHRPSPERPWPPSSSQGVTLARALDTGRVRLRSHCIVSHLRLAGGGARAEGVVVVDGRSGAHSFVAAPLVVLCASTIETLRILLHSGEGQRRGGLIDPSGSLGTGLMDHISSSRFFSIPDLPAPTQPAELSGAGSCFIPNTLNLDVDGGEGREEDVDFRGGYGLWTALQRFDPPAMLRRRRGEAVGFLIGHGEVQRDPANRVTLADGAVDAWGLPVPRIECRWGANERAMVDHMQQRMEAVVAAAGGGIWPVEELFVLPLIEPLVRRAVAVRPEAAPPGYYIHELGGAAMAARAEQGVVDAWNRCWGAPNVLVVDGACWPSAGWQSPTLTSMALAWRACDAAVRERVSLA